jgi:citrate lyase subunit beta/citryl-CoA lyase
MPSSDPAVPGSATARSYLYVPGDAGERLSRAHTRGADAVIADLEDGVAAGRKPEARRQVAQWLAAASAGASPTVTELPPAGPERWVRLNAGDDAIDDLEAVFGPALSGVVLPKISTETEVEHLAAALGRLEQAHRWTSPPVRIMALIESATGLLSAPSIARAPRVYCLQLGELDLAADLGLEPSADESELLAARAAIVTASAAAGSAPPIGAVNPRVDDLAAFESSTVRLRRLGFVGRAAIHPRQIPVIHAIFTPSPDEVAQARRTLTRFDAEQSAGRGVWLDVDGRMIDEAVIRRSRRILALARNVTAQKTDTEEGFE